MGNGSERTQFVNRHQQHIFELQSEIEQLQKKRADLVEENRKLKVVAEQIEFALSKEKKSNEDIL